MFDLFRWPCLALSAAPLLILRWSTAHAAATSVGLPPWICAHPDSVFANHFENGETALPSDASHGSGGSFPGSQTRTLHIAGLGSGTQHYYLYLPPDYSPGRPWPFVLALHGTAPSGQGDQYAMDIRDNWAQVASAGHFIVAAPVGNDLVTAGGVQYQSWLAPPHSGPTDYDLFGAVLADVEAVYNVERTRIYAWGFSAGGFITHDLALETYSSAFNASTMAAYSSSGANLGFACVNDTACGALLAALPRKIPVDIHIGFGNQNYARAQTDYDLFLNEGWIDSQTIFYAVFSGGDEYDPLQLINTWNHFCPNAVVQ